PRILRGEYWLENNAFSRAVADFDTVLDADPDNLPALLARARSYTRAGLTSKAIVDYQHAAGLSPDDAEIAATLQELVETRAARLARQVRYDSAALMDPAFRVDLGTPDAPHHAVIVHAGDRLSESLGKINSAALTTALETGALHVTHLFTYTGQDKTIWANLSLICAGPDNFARMAALLRSDAGQKAVADMVNDAPEALTALHAALPTESPDAAAALSACALDRAHALRYLADWNAKRDMLSWKGVNYYDNWPVFVLDDAPLTAKAFNAALRSDLINAVVTEAPTPEAPAKTPREDMATEPATVAMAPAENVAPEAEPEAVTEKPAQGDNAGVPHPAPRPTLSPTSSAPEGPAVTATPHQAPQNAVSLLTIAPASASRLPPYLKGIWVPTLAECIAYTNRTATPTRLDDAFPQTNAPDAKPFGTILLAGKWLYLNDTSDTRCALQDFVIPAEDSAAPGWTARLTCASAQDGTMSAPVTLTERPSDGPAPHMMAQRSTQEAREMVLCQPIGALSRGFAPLWENNAENCRVTAPLANVRLTFTHSPEQRLTLSLHPDDTSTQPAPLQVLLDSQPWPLETRPGANGWNVDLGSFDAAAAALGAGLVFEIGSSEQGMWRLPLLGSGRAMGALAACNTASD
ncbi:MAG: hypothetical protein CSA11_00010, partial [Chloroflexi bacterium]